MHFSLFFLLFHSLTHIPLLRPDTSLFILIFHPLPRACTHNIQPARRVSFFSLFPDHVIDHLIAMCLPHGFIVTDPIAPSQSVILLVSMFVLCWKPNTDCVQCAFSIYSLSHPWGFSSLKFQSYPQVRSPLSFLFSPPLCLCPLMPFPSSFILSIVLVLTRSYPQRFFNTAVYGPEHRRVHWHLWPPPPQGEYIFFVCSLMC